MSAPNRWAVREAPLVTFYSLATATLGKPVVTLKTLKTSDIETSGTTVYARGGRGNAKLVGFSSDREAKITLQDAIFDNAALAMLTGNSMAAETVNAKMFYEAIPSAQTVSGTVTLPFVPTSIDYVYPVYAGALGSAYTVGASPSSGIDGTAVGVYGTWTTGSNLSFDDADPNTIRIYYTAAQASSKVMTVSSDKFGGTYRIVADVLVRDEETKSDYYGQLIIPNGKIEDNFKFNFSPDGDPSVLDIPIEILKDPDSTDMWQLAIFATAVPTT